jgi:hypothetical protein
VGLIAPSANPYYPEVYDYQASVALYERDSTVTSVTGASQILNPYGPNGDERPPVPLTTPEGYAVLQKEVSGSTYDIYLQVGPTQYERFVKESSAPGDWSTANRSVQSFLKEHQEVYDGRVAIDMDPDFDLISTIAENACGLNPNSNDTDGDGITDTIEYRGCADFDSDSKPDANDTESDGDGIPDALEDKNFNGLWDAGETNALGVDSDGDGLCDGGTTVAGYTCQAGWEDTNRDGVRTANETSPIDRDTDDDGIEDRVEAWGRWCYVGETGCTWDGDDDSGRETGPLDTDSDDDGLWDGLEIGLTSPGVGTDTAVFHPDANPKTVTDPTEEDTDEDGIADGLEDANLNGRVDSGEPSPTAWDTDSDGLPDGNVTISSVIVGEDLNRNGIRDQDADGNWLETDFLANDSDVDGVLDGQETNGTWSYKNGTVGCSGGDKSACVLDPLVADVDGDGLRDGQELAGWTVGVWFERTMEKKANFTVDSNPRVEDSEGDGLSDFAEFMNGSDPRSWDTDGDLILDWDEIDRGSNITGIEGTPPQIDNVHLDVGIDWEWWGFLLLPMKAHVTVTFNVSDNVGLDKVTVTFYRWGREPERRFFTIATAGAAVVNSTSIEATFEFSIFEALVAGADVNITAYDVNQNGASGDFHVDSVLEAVAKAVLAFLSAVAKVIMEAVSAAIGWVLDFVGRAIDSIVRPILDNIRAAAQRMEDSGKRMIAGILAGAPDWFFEGLIGLMNQLLSISAFVPLLVMFLQALEFTLFVMTFGLGAILKPLFGTMTKLAMDALVGTVVSAITDSLVNGLLAHLSLVDITDFLVTTVGGLLGVSSRGICGDASTALSLIGLVLSGAALSYLSKRRAYMAAFDTGFKNSQMDGAISQGNILNEVTGSELPTSAKGLFFHPPGDYNLVTDPANGDVYFYLLSPRNPSIGWNPETDVVTHMSSDQYSQFKEYEKGIEKAVKKQGSKEDAPPEEYVRSLGAAIRLSWAALILSLVTLLFKDPLVIAFFTALTLGLSAFSVMAERHAKEVARENPWMAVVTGETMPVPITDVWERLGTVSPYVAAGVSIAGASLAVADVVNAC